MFYDEAKITVKSGSGGRGCVSFRREKFVPKGGPDGGDGGRGGDVFLEARENVTSLYDVATRHRYDAPNGRPGEGSLKTGASGENLVVPVPVGTIVRLEGSDKVIADLAEDRARVRVAKGGKGGKGNKAFATAVNQAPRDFEEGEPGFQCVLELELRLIADVGFVGLPNAGKSTLLSRISMARPKIASYPFTTKNPILGMVELPGFRRMVMADLPGLIEGAHEGAGLGDQFLRHIERTRVIVHVVDITAPETGDVLESYRVIRKELAGYSETLAAKPEILALSKIDLLDRYKRKKVVESLDREAVLFSAVTGEGLQDLLEAAWRLANPREDDFQAP